MSIKYSLPSIRYIGLFVFFYLLSSIFFLPVSAHTLGQPPYFKVNGEYANLYPVPLTSLSDFALPQDMTPGKYLVNQEIYFELDVSKLPAPPNVVKKTKFSWDFGDFGKGSGLVEDHTYTKIGSYILKIYADDGTTPTPQLLESALINVLPDKNYELPQAVIKVNGKISKDPLIDILKVPLDQSLNFDGSSSRNGSSKIVSYFWDFGDQKSSDQKITVHKYATDLSQIFPVLRVKTQDGFLADSYLELQNQALGSNPLVDKPVSPKPKVTSPSQTKYTLIGLTILLIGSFLVWKKLKK